MYYIYAYTYTYLTHTHTHVYVSQCNHLIYPKNITEASKQDAHDRVRVHFGGITFLSLVHCLLIWFVLFTNT